jgi:repressor LexA
MSLGNRIRRERERMGMNQAELGARVDPQVTREAVTKWENDRSKPRPDTIAQLAALFGMTISELMGEDAGLRSGVRMPLYGWTHAGEPMEEIAGDDYAYVPPVVAERHPRGFLLRVRGGCMDRVIPDGSLVCVDPDAEPTTGRIVVVEPTEGESVMRRIYRGNRWVMLVADSWSGEHEDIVLRDGDRNRLLGVVVWWQAAGES